MAYVKCFPLKCITLQASMYNRDIIVDKIVRTLCLAWDRGVIITSIN